MFTAEPTPTPTQPPPLDATTRPAARARTGRRVSMSGVLLRLFALAVALLMLLPLLYLLLRALGAGERGLSFLFNIRTAEVIGNSLVLALAVVAASCLIGIPFAWLTARTDLPLRRAWLVAGLLPLVIPSYIGAITYLAAFGSKGMLQQILEPLGVTRLPYIYGFFGAWMAVTLFAYPYVVLPVRAALLNMDPALEETAHSLGLRRREVFLRVTLPQLRPALGAGILLNALYTLSDFGAVSVMQYRAFTHVIYQQYRNSFDRNTAAILALLLVVIALVLLFIERRVAHSASTRQHNYRIGVGASRQLKIIKLGAWKIPSLIFCALLVGVGLLVPIGVLLTWLTRMPDIAYELGSLVTPVMNTIVVSLQAGVAATLIALPLAILAMRSRRFGGTVVQLSYVGNSLPGIVVALALVFFAANYLPALYQTLPMLVFGYIVRFLPLSIGSIRSALTQLNPRLEEAGRSLGLKPAAVTRRITMPLIRAGILGGLALVFLSAMKELPTTLLLMPTGYNTLATNIWSAWDAIQYSRIALPALLLIGISALSLALILRRDGYDRD